MANVVIFGTGQLAELAHFYLTEDSPHTIVGFTVNKEYLTEDTYKGLPVVAFEELEEHFPPATNQLFMPISYRNVNKPRKDLFLQGKSRGYTFISYISPKATYYGTPVGENCFIFEDNTIQPFTSIGDNVILWSGNHIGHHSTIKSHCFITSHVVVSGAVTVGECCFIGVNATLRDNITVGDECVIGAAALVMENLSDKAVLIQTKTEPARITSDRLRKI